LVYLIVGGIGIGLLIGVFASWFEKYVDNGPVELVLSLIIPYAAYLVGEEARASGVLAVVACGLYLSRQSARIFSPNVRIQVTGAWQAMTFILNGIVFLLIGLQIPYVLAGIHGGYKIQTLVEYGAIFSMTLIALRMIWVIPAVRLSNIVAKAKGHSELISKRQTFVIGWTGMRGVIALAAAFSVPEVINGQEFGARNLIVFLSFTVILVTLVLQGLTLPAVIRILGLAGKESAMEPEERDARRSALNEALAYLQESRKGKSEAYSHAYDDLIDRYEHRLAALSDDDSEQGATKSQVYQELLKAARGALEAERRTIINLRDEGAISDDVLRKMERVLDLEESKYQLN
jgi:NhaP-type Na+/H+ or K+/H+ antiporter